MFRILNQNIYVCKILLIFFINEVNAIFSGQILKLFCSKMVKLYMWWLLLLGYNCLWLFIYFFDEWPFCLMKRFV